MFTPFQQNYVIEANLIILFLANALILYPLKTPENPWFFGVFRVCEI